MVIGRRMHSIFFFFFFFVGGGVRVLSRTLSRHATTTVPKQGSTKSYAPFRFHTLQKGYCLLCPKTKSRLLRHFWSGCC